MTFMGLGITGPKGRPYVLGDPVDVYDGKVHLGRLQTVDASLKGNELRLEDFITTDLDRLRTWRLARLIMVEVLSFFVERYPSISAIGIVLSADIDIIEGVEGGSATLAGVRERLLQSVGADNIRVTPKPHPRHPAHFAVSGIWQYSRESAQTLADALREERTGYAERLAQAAAAERAIESAMPRSMFSRLLAKDR